MSTVPRVHYFGLTGRGEFIKLILEETGPLSTTDTTPGQKYEFQTHTPGKHRESLGDKLVFGQLPLYEEDDMELVQSGSILRYLAKKHGNLSLFPHSQDSIHKISMNLRGLR